jgi:hypothetical protein
MKALASRGLQKSKSHHHKRHRHPMQRTTMKKGQGVRMGEGTKETCGTVGDIISNSRRQL